MSALHYCITPDVVPWSVVDNTSAPQHRDAVAAAEAATRACPSVLWSSTSSLNDHPPRKLRFHWYMQLSAFSDVCCWHPPASIVLSSPQQSKFGRHVPANSLRLSCSVTDSAHYVIECRTCIRIKEGNWLQRLNSFNSKYCSATFACIFVIKF